MNMAFQDVLAKAKVAEKFTAKSTSIEESAEEDCALEIFQEIWKLKEESHKLKSQLKHQKSKEYWKNPLECDETIDSLEQVDQSLEQVLKDKDLLLSILRNPQTDSDNSLSLKRDRQVDLIDAIGTLAKIVECKQTHLANSAWLDNQSWPTYGKDLDKVNQKLLHIEAKLAKELQDIKRIKTKDD